MKVYSIRDIKAGTYGTPFFQPQDGVAVRSFIDLSMNADSVVGKHPEDFELWCIGEYDGDIGLLQPYQDNVCLGVAATLVSAVAPQQAA